MGSRPKHAEPRPKPRLYLMTPSVADVDAFIEPLSAALSAGDIAAVLLRLEPSDERTLINRVKRLAPLVQEHGAALILDGHAEIVARAGADGAHLTGIAEFTKVLETLKPERIAGIGGLKSRHDAMSAAERGADYVMFGEGDNNGLNNGRGIGQRPFFDAIIERISWWAELFETPCVAFAASLNEIEPLIAAGADFIAAGDFVWRDWRDPQAVKSTVARALSLMHLPERAA